MSAALQGAQSFTKFTLIHKLKLSNHVRLFRFKLPSHFTKLGLPLGQHVFFKAEIEGESVVRPYSPVSFSDRSFDVILKILAKDNAYMGKMSQYLDTLTPGDTVEVSGPAGKIVFQDPNVLLIDDRMIKVNQLGFVAAETGIAPCFQLLEHLAKTRTVPSIDLVYLNRDHQEVLLHSELLAMQTNGLLRLELLDLDSSADFSSYLPPPVAGTAILQCGPRTLTSLSRDRLEKIGHLTVFDF
jgi:NAD(P)H-flavin reductase